MFYQPSVSSLLIVLIGIAGTFLGGCSEDMEVAETEVEVDADTIFIDDVILEDVYYHETSFDSPTILIFPNLTTATHSVYFHLCTNIREVRFPSLVSVGSENSINPYFYFHKNEGLKRIYAPELATVFGYVYAQGNLSLDVSRGICAIADVYPRGKPGDSLCSHAWIDIAGNKNNDICFSAILHECN
jgi:hypothetical protein